MVIKKGLKELKDGDFRVAIFGSARVNKKDYSYKQIKELARMLGERGIDIVTGGGPGLMMAASEGHELGSKKTKAHTVGLGIKLPKEQHFNKHLDLKREFKKFSSRLDYFMKLSSAVIVAPGGVGTLLELFYTWQLVQVEDISDIPIILLGEEWPSFKKWLDKYPLKKKFFEKKDLNHLHLAKNNSEAIDIIDITYREYMRKKHKYKY